MGQHHSNPNVKLAKEGLLPPKPKKMGKREMERLMYAKMLEKLSENFPVSEILPKYN